MREALVTAIANERAALLGAVREVADPAWTAPTACAPWTAKDVLAHLVETELVAGKVYRGELSELQTVDNEEGIGRWSALPAEAIRAALWQHGVATQRVLEAMTQEAWDRPIRALGRTRVPQLARLHLYELGVHGHDITDALGLPAVWNGGLAFLVEFAVRAAPGIFTRLGIPPHGGFGVRTADGSWTIDGRGGDWHITGEPAEHGIELDPSDLVLVTAGRVEVEEVLGRASVSGDRAAARRILAAWQVAGPATPRSP